MTQNIVWITIDSIRYDHSSMSGYRRDTTPNLDRLAADSRATSFDQCITHGKWTGTSTASILTGTSPPTHQIYGASDSVLGETVATVPEMLPEEYTSLSLISNPNAGPAKALDRGFDVVKEFYPSRLLDTVGLRTMLNTIPRVWSHGGGVTTDIERHKGISSYMMADAAKRLVSKQDDPYFMYLHLNSSHHAYLPPASYVDRFTDELDSGPDSALETAQSRYQDIHELIAAGLDDEEWQQVIAMYDAVLSHVDTCVGDLVDAIRRMDEDPIVVITGDHGDLLGEYGLAGHKFALHDALIHVPLVTHGLDGIDHQSDNVVQHIDVLRTLLSQVGVDHEQLEGIDLTTATREFAVSQRSGENARKNLEKTREYDPEYELPVGHPSTLTSIRSTDHKLLYGEDGDELFALPDESTDVRAAYEDTYETMLSYAEIWLEDHDSEGGAVERTEELDADLKEQLSDMGYLV